MAIQKAIEIVNSLLRQIGLADLDFADLAVDLIVDDEHILLEYLPEAGAFLVIGKIAENVDPTDAAILRQLSDLAHHLAMSGGAAVTLDSRQGRIVYTMRLPIDGLTAEWLGSTIGITSEMLPTLRAAFAEPAALATASASVEPDAGFIRI